MRIDLILLPNYIRPTAPFGVLYFPSPFKLRSQCYCDDEYDTYGEIIYSRTDNFIDEFCEEEICGGQTGQCGGRDWSQDDENYLAVYRTDVPL